MSISNTMAEMSGFQFMPNPILTPGFLTRGNHYDGSKILRKKPINVGLEVFQMRMGMMM